ncbi:nuclear receptor coactivator 7 isoform X8 [Carettochelys insculpta]|uniref:nuclear receptor coactivator 7 isoform X8 n=1 Tax=Carettochelys insculpta TaxID=44489 RepID=UPI003EBA15E1
MFAAECCCAHEPGDCCRICRAAAAADKGAACQAPRTWSSVESEETLSSGYSSANADSCESLPEVVAWDPSSLIPSTSLLGAMHSFSVHKHFSWCVDYRQPYLLLDDNQNKTNEKKEKKMVIQKPPGTTEYTAGSQDTLNSIALKFNITPNKLVELNKLFTHTIVPGQVLYVPDTDHYSSAARLASSSPGAPISPSSSDAEYDKLPDADLARKACKPIERVLSSTSEEDEPIVVKFLKMNCRYFTDGKGVVGGVMIVTPNNIMFDPHKSDPLVIENGCEEYGLICPMEEVVSIALYNDISHMQIKDALPSKDEDGSQSSENLHKAGIGEGENNKATGVDLTLNWSEPQANKHFTVKSGDPNSSCDERKEPSLEVSLAAVEEKDLKESVKYSSIPSLDKACQETQLDSNSEIRLWLLQRIQVPIEDMLPSKEEKSKTPPMFLCIKVGKPMRKSFVTQSTTMAQQYGKRRKQPEYWFAVPRERVDHLYTFFVQWSPEVYGKDAKEQGFVVVEKEELDMIDNFFSEPSTKSWEIITVEEAKRRKSICSYYEEDEDDSLPVLKHHSALLENMHIEQLARYLPARVQGYPWRLAYSTLEHGTSLKTLYRKSASLDNPVLLVIKDMDNQIFGAYATHPFRCSDHYYGTGETFLYTFSPNFKVFKWSGENTYFINGDISSLELGGGGGRFGLWLDADLYHGRSNSCSTFNNDILSKKEDFIIQDVEVWTFE